MKRKTAWLILGCLIVATLVLASCSSDTTTDTSTDTTTDTSDATVEDTGPKMVTDSLGRQVQEPQYGGRLTWVYSTGSGVWEIHSGGTNWAAAGVIFETLLFPDWLMGPAGTSESRMDAGYFPLEDMVGGLAESWEQLDLTTAIYHIRPGVKWQNNPLLNGRELVADDVVYSIKAAQDHTRSFNYKAPDQPRRRAVALDKYTVQVTLDEADVSAWYYTAGTIYIIPPEIEQEGLNWEDWNTASGTGTGAYVLEEAVEGASYTLVRNPDYWLTDPLHPENQLPYLDSMKVLDITDWSARLAAFITGKIDRLVQITGDQMIDLAERSPNIQSYELSAYTYNMVLRSDHEIFDDLRVRKALHMAVDNDAIVRDFYGDAAVWDNFPFDPSLGPNVYTSYAELPAETRDIYTYNPDEAKRLLAEAGYADGFDFQVEVYPNQVVQDAITIYQKAFKDIGVDMTINEIEGGTFWSMTAGREYEDAVASPWGSVSIPSKVWMYLVSKEHRYNYINKDDPYISEQYDKLAALVDPVEIGKVYKSLYQHLREEAYFMTLPSPSPFTVWQPWVKGFHGEFISTVMMDYRGGGGLAYSWLDQDVKTEMGY